MEKPLRFTATIETSGPRSAVPSVLEKIGRVIRLRFHQMGRPPLESVAENAALVDFVTPLAKEVRRGRPRRGNLSQTEIAEKIGVSQSTVSRKLKEKA